MATQPEYTYIPMYGVEEYDALGVPSSAQVGGGAKDTNDNLLVSLWSNIEEGGANFFPVSGDLVKPSYAFGGDWLSPLIGGPPFLNNIPNVGWKSTLRSRYSARFLINAKKTSPSPIEYPVLGFMRAPLELRQMLAGSVEAADGGGINILKPILDQFAWNIYSTAADEEGERQSPGTVDALVGGIFSELPFYVGDGSDGVFPTPLANAESILDGQSPAALISALNSGNFSVPVFLFPDPFDPAMITIEWPHSIGRG